MSVVVLAVALALLAACRHGTTPATAVDPHRASLDSIVKAVNSIDSLEVMALQFRQQHDDVGEMIALKRQGLLLRNQARYASAIKVHNMGLQVATRLADTLEMCEALNNLGISYRRLGDLSVANSYHYKSKKLLDAYSGSDDDDAMFVKSLTLNGIANIEIKLCNFIVADSVLREAMNNESRVNNDVGIAINACDLGRVKQELGQIDSAWHYLHRAMECSRNGGFALGVALCHQRMGELHEKEQRFSHAREEYKTAYDSFMAFDDSWHLQQTCLDLARVNILLDEQDDAHRYLDQVEAEAARTGCKSHQAEASMIHYQLSLLRGNTHEALEHYIRATELSDSICGVKKGDEMRSQLYEYQIGVKSGEMDVLNRDINNLKRQRNTQWLLSLLLLLLAIVGIGALIYIMRERMYTQHIMRQIEETRSLFFTNVVHRLRTPLTAIMGAIDDITGQGADDSQRDSAELVKRSGQHLLTLMDRILEVGSVRSAITELDWSTGDAVTYVRMILDTYHEQCAQRHIELTYAPRESNMDIDIVPRYLNTVVHSLIDNALNYSRDFSQISVTSMIEDDYFVLRVADTGMGIAPADLPHVFEPFYRGAAAEQMVDGVGIGLTVVRDMAMALGGTVDVESVEGQGSVFTVRVPCRYEKKGFKGKLSKLLPPSPHESQLQPQQSDKQHTPDAAPASDDRPVVLVVEDNADVARLVGSILVKDFAVHYAHDGKHGLAMACELVPHLVITDVKMPLMDGYEFTQRLRATSGLSHIPVIILSARTSDEARVRGIKAGANAYLVKPFVREELLAWVNNLLSLSHTMRNAGLHDQETAQPQAAPTPDLQKQDDDDGVFLSQFASTIVSQLSSGDKLDLDKIALSFKMGESQLKRKIHDLTGKNITSYIAQLRMEEAMRLLRQQPDMLIGDVALKCGFADVAYFSRVFRQHYGKTPTQARNDHLNT